MNLALIGCGARGDELAAAARSLGHTIAACADASSPAAKRTAAKFGVPFTTRPVHAIAAADAILVTSPSPRDIEPATHALGAGLPVYWAAPLAHHPKHARRLLDAAAQAGAVLAPADPARSCPQFAAASAQVTAGAIGEVGFVRVHRHAARGDALDSLAGDLDWIAETFGRVTSVFAQIVRKKSVDAALLTLTLGSGPLVQCVASVAPDASDRAAIELCGASGMVQFTTSDAILSVAPHTATSSRAAVASSPLDPPVIVRRLRQFFDAIDAGPMSARQRRHEEHVLRVVEAAVESAGTARAVKIGR